MTDDVNPWERLRLAVAEEPNPAAAIHALVQGLADLVEQSSDATTLVDEIRGNAFALATEIDDRFSVKSVPEQPHHSEAEPGA